jgi:hypothetical protein
MNIPYHNFLSYDSYRPAQECRNVGRRKQSSKHNHLSHMAESFEYDWEANEKEKTHHTRFCRAVRHADGLNERFAIVEFPFHPYWNRIHQCFHVGRNRRIDPNAAIEFLRDSRSRDRLTTL